jgi:phosphoribosylglycinamide formyltransferase-1
MKHICVFASGTGSNFEAIFHATKLANYPCKIQLLVSDKPHSKAVEKAKTFNIDTFAFNASKYKNKTAFELVILKEMKNRNIDLIVLAGYMRLIGSTLLKAYPKRILNIHPSLLPLYKGKDAVGQAMIDNATQTGVTVHFVDEGMDTGEIIAQESLSITNLSSREEIETEVHKIEHKLYPQVIKKVLEELE